MVEVYGFLCCKLRFWQCRKNPPVVVHFQAINMLHSQVNLACNFVNGFLSGVFQGKSCWGEPMHGHPWHAMVISHHFFFILQVKFKILKDSVFEYFFLNSIFFQFFKILISNFQNSNFHIYLFNLDYFRHYYYSILFIYF